MRIPVTSTLALSAATLACTIKVDNGDTDATTAGPPGTGGETGETTASPPTTGTTDAPTTTGPTTDSEVTTDSEATTGELAPAWCHGFNPDGPMTLTLDNRDGDEILADGSELQLDCGGQGLLMFPVFPHFGGFVPDNGESVSFDVTLDVEGYNVGPGGHFFSTTNYSHEVNCAHPDYETYGYYNGYSNAFIAVFPPDSIPDIATVHGKPGVLHVTMHAPGQDVAFDANVIMHAVLDDFGGACGYG